MKLVSYVSGSTPVESAPHATGRGGILLQDKVYDLAFVCDWAKAHKGLAFNDNTTTVFDFVSLPAGQRQALAGLVAQLPDAEVTTLDLSALTLRAPLEVPPSVRDFYAFEQHVKTARANRGLGMIPEWYNFPVFYFSNHRAIYGPEDNIPYPRHSQALDFELEMACVIGATGRNIAASEASSYIAGYTIMNDWSARDLQMEEMKLNMGPVKGKDFATSLGPWLVTPDELAGARVKEKEGAEERFDLAMVARLNGKEISQGNFSSIYYSFPQMIERASLNTWLVPGDVLGSGTVGTGCLLEQGDKRERWLQAGDVMEMEIEHLGVLRNKVVKAEE